MKSDWGDMEHEPKQEIITLFGLVGDLIRANSRIYEHLSKTALSHMGIKRSPPYVDVIDAENWSAVADDSVVIDFEEKKRQLRG